SEAGFQWPDEIPRRPPGATSVPSEAPARESPPACAGIAPPRMARVRATRRRLVREETLGSHFRRERCERAKTGLDRASLRTPQEAPATSLFARPPTQDCRA